MLDSSSQYIVFLLSIMAITTILIIYNLLYENYNVDKVIIYFVVFATAAINLALKLYEIKQLLFPLFSIIITAIFIYYDKTPTKNTDSMD